MMPHLRPMSNVSNFICTIIDSDSIKENCRKCKLIMSNCQLRDSNLVYG